MLRGLAEKSPIPVPDMTLAAYPILVTLACRTDDRQVSFRGDETTVGYLSFGPIENNIMFFVTSACARRTGAAARVERRRREH